jgi:hypothetical protein
MKKQEIFDAVVKHLMAAPSRSVNLKTNACMYRTSDGAKCAVGAILPDECYRPEMDHDTAGTSIRSLVVNHPEWVPFWMRRNVELLQVLQTVHDTSANWMDGKSDMIRKLHKVADDFKLKKRALPALP